MKIICQCMCVDFLPFTGAGFFIAHEEEKYMRKCGKALLRAKGIMRIGAAAVLAAGLFASCAQTVLESKEGADGVSGRAAAVSKDLTGPNGTVTVSGMTNASLTVTYTAAMPVDVARIYISPGNAGGLVFAAQAMNRSGNTWTFTGSHPSWVPGAKIYLDVLTNSSAGEKNVPQGTLGDMTSWASFNYAEGGPEGFRVSFDDQGAGTPAVPSSILVEASGGTVGALPTAPIKAGYTFLGWYTGPNGSGASFTASTPVTANTTVYAKWKPVSGGLVLNGPNGSVAISAMTGTSLTVTCTPAAAADQARLFLSQGNGLGLVVASQPMTKSGSSWTWTGSHPSFVPGARIYIDVLASASGIEKNIPQGTLSNTTSWGFFEYGEVPPFATVSFDSAGADVPASPGAISVAEEGDAVGALPSDPSKALAEFGGWFTGSGGTGEQFLASTPVTGDLTVYAYWIGVPSATVTFIRNYDANDSDIVATKEVAAGSPAGTLPANPTRSGYTFEGWTIARDSVSPAFTADSVVQNDMNVYAQWTPYIGPELIELAPGKHMTMQFVNRTDGAWADSDIYLTMLARNEAQDWCWVKADGTLQRMSVGDNGQLSKNGRLCANYSLRLSDMEGFQLPAYVSSGRVFVTLGEPLYLTVNVDGNGRVAYAAPNLNNTTDPNSDVYFDWYEFAIVPATWAAGSPIGFWGNMTQVDAFTIPMLAKVYEKDGSGGATYLNQNGTTMGRDEIWSLWDATVPVQFQGLKNEYRINAPCKDPSGFGLSAPNAAYYNSYVDQIWNQYRTQDLTFSMYWDGATYTYTGRVQGDAFVFSRPGRQNFVAVARKPNATEIFEASGVLATGNTEEGAIQARISAAFNRHVMENSSLWDEPASFYQAAPCNYYSKFMHDIAVNGKAYGFAYDDVGDFSGALWSYNARAVVIDIFW